MAGLLLAGALLAWQSYEQQRTIAEVNAIVAKYSVPGSANGSPARVRVFDPDLSKAVTAIAEGAAADARYAKALELLEAGKPTEAEPLLEAVAEQEKLRAAHAREQAAAAYVNLGSITRLSDPKRALEAYSEAVALDPDNAEALFGQARSQEDAGNFDVAEQGYKRLLDLEKDGKCKNCRYDLMTAAKDLLRDLDMRRFQTRPDTPANF
jgi:tetratricopeptide (TPR) repeat protein